MKANIWIVDFGSQYTQLITRVMRELGYTSLIMTLEETLEEFKQKKFPQALVLSGGPQSIFEDEHNYAPFFENPRLPVLGICYGMQIMGHRLGGKVERGTLGEYGPSNIHAEKNWQIEGVPAVQPVWMSHSDHVTHMPMGFKVIYKSENGLVAGMCHESHPWMGLQFHPEVQHSPFGKKILGFFLEKIAHLQADWNPQTMLSKALEELKPLQGKTILCAFSGGVDSLVAATLLQKVAGEKLYCFFVDHGLLRPQDIHHIHYLQKQTSLKIEVMNVEAEFLEKLRGVKDPEEKRKIIGKTFIEVFEKKVHQWEKEHQIHFEYLLQGTLYPDVIESISPHKKGGKSVTIKSHHNVGGLPETMKLKLVEPLRFLFKDEVRQLGRELGLEHECLWRHPFPGPGIGVRVLGELTSEKIRKVQHADQILFEELKRENLYQTTWQAFTVLIPQKTVGVKGDGRAYEEIIALRMVNSQDGMTATVTELPWSFLHKVSNRICNEVKGVTRVVYDLTSKPPGTIEWD
jgi:GMP synthase (glutamine-hydrolysing)